MKSARVLSALVIAITAVLPFLGLVAQAQTAAAPAPFNGAIIDWSAATYVPSFYTGKRLPTTGSPVQAWVSVFQNGKLVDASRYSIRWYADSQLLRSGIGATSVQFKAPFVADKVVNLQARIQPPSGNLIVEDVQVPAISPKVAIAGSYPGNVITGSPAHLTALPYFFNVSDPSALAFQWTANGAPAQNAEDPQSATLNFGDSVNSGTTVAVKVVVTDPSTKNTASGSANFIYQKI